MEPTLEEQYLWKSPWFYLWVAAFIASMICMSGCGHDPYRAVCQLRVNDGMWGTEGSGTLIAANSCNGIVLTCRHVAQKEGNLVTLKWLNADDQVTKGTVLEVLEGDDFQTDQALILTPLPEGVRPLPVGEFDPAAGPLVSVGWRDGDFYESVAFDAFEEGGVIKTNQPFIGGMSGGPSLQNGNVVGVAVGSNRTDSSITSNGEHLKALINSIPQ